jgi:hypothetical protein
MWTEDGRGVHLGPVVLAGDTQVMGWELCWFGGLVRGAPLCNE